MPGLSTAQQSWLIQHLSVADPTAPTDDVSMIDTGALLDIDTCRAVLDTLTPIIGSPSRAVTASLLGKRIAFLVTTPTFYAMSAFDVSLDVRLANTVTDYTHREGLWRSRLRLRDWTSESPLAGQRTDRREVIAHRVFAGHLAPLWASFTAASGISPRILWENTAVRVYSLYERRLAAVEDVESQHRARSDFEYLVQTATPDVFGTTHNPLATYFFERTGAPAAGAPAAGRLVRFRKTCCFYFRATTPPEYCSTCPLLRRPARRSSKV